MKLPLLFICNNNQLSVSTPRSTALAPKKLSDIGIAFGMPSWTVDGMDVDVVAAATQRAVQYVRSKQGPAFLEFISFRFASHSTTARETRNAPELAAIRSKCAIDKKLKALKNAGTLTDDAEAELNRTVTTTVTTALQFADASEYPDVKEALTDVI
jgi:TPP-dependent pyruvate/acetoin dehydrogenase alpha subunit